MDTIKPEHLEALRVITAVIEFIVVDHNLDLNAIFKP